MNELDALKKALDYTVQQIKNSPSNIEFLYNLLVFIYDNFNILNNENIEFNECLKQALKSVLEEKPNNIDFSQKICYNNKQDNSSSILWPSIKHSLSWRMENKEIFN